jgi:uncharacterized protein YlxW (UPF0749 family)
MSEQMNQVNAQLEKLKEAEENAKSAINDIQQKVDEYAKEMATQNAEHKERIGELEVGIGILVDSI